MSSYTLSWFVECSLDDNIIVRRRRYNSPWDTLFSRIKLVSGVFIYQNKGNFLEIYVINVNKLFSVTFYFMKLFNIFYHPFFLKLWVGTICFFMLSTKCCYLLRNNMLIGIILYVTLFKFKRKNIEYHTKQS